jgi:hypothetical protein
MIDKGLQKGILQRIDTKNPNFNNFQGINALFVEYLKKLKVPFFDECCPENSVITPIGYKNGDVVVYNTTTNQWDILAISGGGGNNFANADLTATGNRTHDFNGNYLYIDGLSSGTLRNDNGDTTSVLEVSNGTSGVYSSKNGTSNLTYVQSNSGNILDTFSSLFATSGANFSSISANANGVIKLDQTSHLSINSSEGTAGQVITSQGAGVPPIWADAGSGEATFTPSNITTFGAGGIAVGTDLGSTPISIQELMDMIFYAYAAPTISLSSSVSTALREYGNIIPSLTLSATTVKKSDPITSVTFFRNGTLVDTVATPLPNGGVETYSSTPPVTGPTTFYSRVSDGTSTVQSNTLTYSFVYPFYFGVGAQGLTNVQIASLTKSIQTKQNTNTITSPTSQVFYFAYPSSYGFLTSILDTNGFETIGDYIVRSVVITGLDGTPQNYRVYEYANLTTQVNFTNQYKF